MTTFISFFTCLCGSRKKTQPSPLETTETKQPTDDLQNKETDDLHNKAASEDRDNEDNNVTNSDLPLPPARKEALQGTYSCKNMVLRKSMSTKKKLSASLSIQMPRSLSMARKRDGEEDKSKKKLKAENSICVRPIILGERCKVRNEEDEEGDEEHSQRMPKNRIYRPRSMSSISISRTNSMKLGPVDESMKTKENNDSNN